MTKAIIIIVIAIIHLGLTVGLAVSTFNMDGFMFGVYPRPDTGLLHRGLAAAYTVLMFPFGHLANSMSADVRFLGWPLVALNSLLWSALIYVLLVRRFFNYKPKDATPVKCA